MVHWSDCGEDGRSWVRVGVLHECGALFAVQMGGEEVEGDIMSSQRGPILSWIYVLYCAREQCFLDVRIHVVVTKNIEDDSRRVDHRIPHVYSAAPIFF